MNNEVIHASRNNDIISTNKLIALATLYASIKDEGVNSEVAFDLYFRG